MAKSNDPLGPDDSVKQLIERFGNLQRLRQSFDTATAEDRDSLKDEALERANRNRSSQNIVDRSSHEIDRLKLENESIKQRHEDQKANRDMRFKYSEWVFRYLVGYSVIVGVILIFAGFKLWKFSLDPEVLKFLVGSTAASSIGLVAAVTIGLFNNKK